MCKEQIIYFILLTALDCIIHFKRFLENVYILDTKYQAFTLKQRLIYIVYPSLCPFCAGSKNIYTDASKQMLISSPPPVLTLHLKRFQQVRHFYFTFIPLHR